MKTHRAVREKLNRAKSEAFEYCPSVRWAQEPLGLTLGAEELWFPLEEYSHLLARGQIVCSNISQRRETFRD